MTNPHRPAKIGKGRSVHMGVFTTNGTWTLCVNNFNVSGAGSQGDVVPAEGPVTCKRCLKRLAARIIHDHTAAIAEDIERAHSAELVEQERREAAEPVAHWVAEGVGDEGQFVVNGTRFLCDVLVAPSAPAHAGPCFDAVDRVWQPAPPAPTRKQRRAARRQQRATLRAQAPQVAAAARARRGARKGLPQTARTLLAASGVPDDMAKRYAPVFSKGVTPDATRSVRIRKGAGRSERGNIKLYCPATFKARLSVYRPRNPLDALVFAAAAS